MIILSFFACFINEAQSLFSSGCRIYPDFCFLHKQLNGVADIRVIIYCKDPGNTAFLPEFLVLLVIGNAQFQFHGKQASLFHFAGNLYGSAHKFYNVFGYGHAKARPLNLICRTVLRSGKSIENSFQIFRSHAVSIIFHFNPNMLILG